jgi:hypothetical protein
MLLAALLYLIPVAGLLDTSISILRAIVRDELRTRSTQAALELAQAVLPEREFRRLRHRGYVEAWGTSGNHYRIAREKMVYVVGKYYLCIGPADQRAYPPDDLVVLYYLQVTANEKDFLQRANPIVGWQG